MSTTRVFVSTARGFPDSHAYLVRYIYISERDGPETLKREWKAKVQYVVNLRKGYVTHQGNWRSCEDYVNNVTSLGFGEWEDFSIAEHATERDDILRSLKRK